MLQSLRAWARRIKADTLTLYLACRDPRTPWYARLLGVLVVAYALSPIDLIPDFIPVLGYLDDLILLPLGIALVVRLIPPDVLAASRERAVTLVDRPTSRTATVLIALAWIAAALAVAWWAWRALLG